jgi:N-acyl-L-homoserine lactone synthetase
MIRFIYADALKYHPVLAESMFKDRAEQFKNRLDWDVTVSEYGWEKDEYDDLNPLYLIWENADGTHGGSMRTLPTLGRCMTNEHFVHLTDGVKIESPTIWECTRYCLSPDAKPGVAAALLLAGCEMGLRFGLTQALGVFDARMPRIYGRIGWKPDVIGTEEAGRDSISVGLWEISEEARQEISDRSGIPLTAVARWFELSFEANVSEQQAAA